MAHCYLVSRAFQVHVKHTLGRFAGPHSRHKLLFSPAHISVNKGVTMRGLKVANSDRSGVTLLSQIIGAFFGITGFNFRHIHFRYPLIKK